MTAMLTRPAKATHAAKTAENGKAGQTNQTDQTAEPRQTGAAKPAKPAQPKGRGTPVTVLTRSLSKHLGVSEEAVLGVIGKPAKSIIARKQVDSVIDQVCAAHAVGAMGRDALAAFRRDCNAYGRFSQSSGRAPTHTQIKVRAVRTMLAGALPHEVAALMGIPARHAQMMLDRHWVAVDAIEERNQRRFTGKRAVAAKAAAVNRANTVTTTHNARNARNTAATAAEKRHALVIDAKVIARIGRRDADEADKADEVNKTGGTGETSRTEARTTADYAA